MRHGMQVALELEKPWDWIPSSQSPQGNECYPHAAVTHCAPQTSRTDATSL